MLTLLMHLRSPGFSGVRFAVFCVMFHRSLFVMLVIVLSVPLRFIVSDYHFGIFNLFLSNGAFIVLPCLIVFMNVSVLSLYCFR